MNLRSYDVNCVLLSVSMLHSAPKHSMQLWKNAFATFLALIDLSGTARASLNDRQVTYRIFFSSLDLFSGPKISVSMDSSGDLAESNLGDLILPQNHYCSKQHA